MKFPVYFVQKLDGIIMPMAQAWKILSLPSTLKINVHERVELMKMLKRFTSVVLAAVLLIASTGMSVSAAETTYRFTDIKGTWAADLIEKWAQKGIVSGYSDGTFKPSANVTGAELTSMVNKLLVGTTVADLENVPAAIVENPSQAVTREAALIVLYKAFGFEAKKDAWNNFKDGDQISTYAVEAVNNLYERNFLEGYSDGTLRPQQLITRAEIIKLINKYSQMGYYADAHDGITANPDITILRQTGALGESVYAMAIKYNKVIDGTTLKTSDFTVEATLGDVTGARTISKVYTNDSATTTSTSKNGQYVILELGATDQNSGTMFYDFALGMNILYHLNYYVTQTAPITAADSTKIVASAKQQNGSEVNPLVDQFAAATYTSTTGHKIDYRLFTPKTETGKKYPLVIFLNGNGERGVNGVTQLLGNAGGTTWATTAVQDKNPCFVLAPQNPLIGLGLWLDDNVYTTTLQLIKTMAANPQVDTSRIYITGMSMGGFGTWMFIERNPELFAAAMPVCGGADLTQVSKIKDMPIWAFHAADDPVVNITGEIGLYMPSFMMHGTRDVVSALKAAGSTKINYTEYPAGFVAMPLAPMAHFAWVPAYQNQEALDWMFKQSK